MKLKNIFAFLLLFVVGLQSVKALEAYTVLNGSTLTFYYDNLRASRPGTSYNLNTESNSPEWRAEASNVNSVVFDASFANARPTTTCCWFADMENLTSITGLSYLNTSEVTNMEVMFSQCKALTSLDLSHFNTEKVTSMYCMFASCENLTSLDLSSFNTSNVTNMSSMFIHCIALTSLDVSHFNTENVTKMLYMFCRCRSLTSLDVSNFNTVKAIDMQSMFEECSSLTSLDLCNFNTASVTDMAYMFDGCKTLTSLDVSSFNTESLKRMRGMFRSCSSLTSLDVSNFNTQNSVELNDVFKECSSLTTLDLSNFNTENVTNMSSMFQGCTNLTSVNLSGFNTEQVITMSEMFRACYSLLFLDLGSFNTANVANMSNMFAYSHDLRKIYVGADWNTDGVNLSDDMFIACTSLVGEKGIYYDENHTDKAYAHIDEGTANPGYLSTALHDFMKDDFFYKITDDNTVEVIGDVLFIFYYNYSSDVIIPATVDYRGTTYIVRTIGKSAFAICTGLTEVTIPNSIVEIGNFAFDGCTYLRTITCLAPTPPTVYSNTFSNYDVRLIVPSASKSLYQTAPYWKNFTNIQEKKNYDFEYGGIYYKDMGGNVSAAVTYKDSDYGTYSGDVVIPEEVWNENDEWYYTVSQIGERAFYRCPSLKSVTIPATVDLIDGDAFLDSFVEFPTESSITCLAKRPPTVSPYAFGSGIADMTLYVRKGCKAAYEAANYWKNFGSIVELPYHFQVKQIYYKITGENTVSVVNRDSNYYSYWSQNTIPATVNYEGVTYTVTKIDNVAFFNCPQLIRVIMPSTITEIGNRSFKNCPRLTSITIPKNVQSIGIYAFDGCTGLNLGDITCLATTPPSIDYTTFTESQYQGASLYVPYGCYNLYWNAPNWEYFRNIFELPPDDDAINEVAETVKETPWYDLSGRKVTNPRKGIYIKNGSKVLVK